MADAITAPISIDTSPLIITSLEEYKRAIGKEEIAYILLDYRQGLATYSKNERQISVPSARITPYASENNSLAEAILRYSGVPDRLIEEMQRKSVRKRKTFLLWMPTRPLPITFFDKILGRRRHGWQMHCGDVH